MNAECSLLHDGSYVAIVGGKIVGKLRVNEPLNCVGVLTVISAFRRKGIAMNLIRFAVKHRGSKFARTPDGFKNAVTMNFGSRHPEFFLDE